MSQNYLIASMDGLLALGKSPKAQKAKKSSSNKRNVQKELTVHSSDSAGFTGVAKYLQTIPAVTGVAKYLKKKELRLVTGVDRYLLNQSIAKRDAPVISGVSKYVAKVTGFHPP